MTVARVAVLLMTLGNGQCCEEGWIGAPAGAHANRWHAQALAERSVQRPPAFVHYRSAAPTQDKAAANSSGRILYSFASLDLSQEPVVLSVLAMGNRTWSVEVTDSLHRKHHVIASPLASEQDFQLALIGPDYSEAIPSHIVQLRMPTNVVLLAGRTTIDWTDDEMSLTALQNQYRLSRITQWIGSRRPSRAFERHD